MLAVLNISIMLILLCLADWLSWIKKTFGVLLGLGAIFFSCLIFSPRGRIVLPRPAPKIGLPNLLLGQEKFQKRSGCNNPALSPVWCPDNNLCRCFPRIQEFL